MLVARFVILILLAVAQGCSFLMEQPNSTLMDRHAKFRFLEALNSGGTIAMHKIHLWMGLFGADTPKVDPPLPTISLEN